MTASSQSQQVNEYIREVCSRVRAREVHPDIRAELTNHLEELSEDIKTHSPEISNEDAITTAIQQMGDPADVGSRLNRIHRPRTDWRFVGTVAALLGFALIIMYSADKSLQVRPSVQTIDLFSKKLLSIGIGLLLLVVVRMIDYRKISAYSVPIYWSTIVVMLFALMNGEHVNGTQQYITLLGIHFPLLALSPYVLIVVLAGLLTKQKNKHNWSVQWAVYVSPALVLYLLSFRITEFVFFFIVALALFMFTYRNKAIAVLAPLVHVFVIPALLLLFNGSFLQPGFRQRVSNFFNLDPYQGMVNPVVQSLDIIREAGWFGNGIGAPFTNMSLYYIHSDWIYTYMIFALGWAGGLAVLWTVAALLYRILQAAVTVKDPFGKYMIKGLGLLLGLKFVWSIAMTIGWLPFTSVQFPLIAFGGSSMFADMIALGFMMGIYRRKDMIIVSKEQRIVS